MFLTPFTKYNAFRIAHDVAYIHSFLLLIIFHCTDTLIYSFTHLLLYICIFFSYYITGAMKICVKMSICFNSSYVNGSYVKYMYTILKNCQTIFKVAISFYIVTSNTWNFSLLYIFINTWYGLFCLLVCLFVLIFIILVDMYW